MDEKLIAEAISSLELIDIHLYSTSIKRFEEISSENYPDNMSQQNRLSVSADILKPEDKSDKSRLINVNVKVEFELKFIVAKDNGETITLAEIDACFIAKYHQLQEVSEEAIGEFMKFNVVHNVFPFWREHAFRLFAQAKLPTPMIPLHKTYLREKYLTKNPADG